MEGLQVPLTPSSPGTLTQNIQGGERSKSSGWEGDMVVALGGFQELKVKLQMNLSKYIFFPGIFMETHAKRRRPIPSCIPSFPLSKVIYGLATQVGFFPSPFIFSSLPFLPCFCKLNYLNALFGSLKSQRFPLFPPWLPFLSLLSAPAFSGSFPVLFQWHLLKFAQKKILLQCHHFSPGRRFMGAGRHPWRGGFARRKKRRKGRKCGGKAKDAQSWGAGREQGDSPAPPQVAHVVTQARWGLVSGLCGCIEGAQTPLGGLRHQ